MTNRIALLLCIAALFAPMCFAQANLATMTGIVTDAAEGVIPGANVTIINTGTGIARELSTNAVGGYTFTSLRPGSYELIVTSDGFRQYTQTGIVLQTGQTLRSDVQLEIGQVTESVTVDAQLVTLNTESGTIKGDVIVMEEIQELPLNGRDFTDLAFFVPGVIPKAEGGQGSAPPTPISTSMDSTTATPAALPRRCARTSTPCKSSRWRSRATRPSTAAWLAGS
jgi:hypothetical protein